MAGAAMGTAFRHLRGLFGGSSVVALEDGLLLARFKHDGDEAAFEALIARHGPMVLTICRAVLRNEHDVEDAFQATFLVLARKASSIRRPDTLGGWLHRVAYRASVQASIEAIRRRRKEAEAAMSRWDTSGVGQESELTALLHEEIDRLPESHRLPIVLCDLEGLTYEQAAEQLRWTVPTLRNRLARARQRLKDRLTSLEIAPLASVPPALARTTLSAATGASVSAGASLLCQSILKGMFMAKIKLISTAALAALALASAGLIAAGRPDDPKPAKKPEAQDQAAKPAVEEPAGLVEIRGIVVDPGDKPVAGAKVWATTRRPVRETTTGPDGRFRLRVPPPDPSAPVSETGGYPRVAASAPGFGLGWIKKAFEPGPSGESTIRLVEDGPPIEGRILDTKGQPVAGLRVQLNSAWVVDRVSFESWLAQARADGPNSLRSLVGVSTSIEAETGPDGRFTLAGLGRDRVASLLVTGPAIATTRFQVTAYDGPEIRRALSQSPIVIPPRPEVFHARKFEAVVGSTRPIEGVVRDKDTGRGIEGLTIHAALLDLGNQAWDAEIVATTDAEGLYRLLGMPAAPSYRLFVDQPPDRVLPYVSAALRTPVDVPAVGPVRVDVALKRGVMVRGRVTDKATARPVPGSVEPHVFADSPSLADFPHYAPYPRGRARTDPDGRFELVTPPGRGLLAFRADRDDYINALGAEAIAGFDPQLGGFRTRGQVCRVIGYNVVAEINLDPGAESATFDLQVNPGRSLDLTVLGPEGRPADGLMAVGLSGLNIIATRASSSLKVRALDPTRPRRVNVYDETRKLVGSIWLKGDEVGPLNVRMVPWGTVVGRFLDAEGNPLAAKLVQIVTTNSPRRPETEGPPRPTSVNSAPTTDKDGRFRIEGLVPGLKYAARPLDPAKRISNPPGFDDVVVAPGEVKDLGDLKPPLPRK